MEHPADPVARQPVAPSIWRLGITQTLIAMGARIVYIDQCRYGSPSRKPTMLLTCNARWLWDSSFVLFPPAHLRGIPHVKHSLGCNCRRPHMKTLIGIGEDGHFNTAAATIYPGGFCELLARTRIWCHMIFGAMAISQMMPSTTLPSTRSFSPCFTKMATHRISMDDGIMGAEVPESSLQPSFPLPLSRVGRSRCPGLLDINFRRHQLRTSSRLVSIGREPSCGPK